MLWFLAWLVAVELLGVCALPLAVRLFRSLPDRGYLFAKPLGVLAVAYLAWILGTFGMLRFQQATIALIALALGLACWIAWGREALGQLARVRTALWVSEGLFVLAFALAAWIRAHNPEISGTEKPMDFALLNALYRTDSFPPEDPWMSGNSISYYYFGYLLLATVAKLSGVPAAVGYNLGVALVFGLLVACSFSLAFNLISALGPRWQLFSRLAGAMLAPLMIGIMGNLEGGLELLAARGVGDASFWKWIGVKGLEAAAQPTGWFPTTHWWWWRASRVIPTIKPDGINEFPYFSFLLGDLHPHYTALPWALLAVAFAMAALYRRMAGKGAVPRDWVAYLGPALALGFLLVGNSWDFPTYTALFWTASLVLLVPSDWTRERLLPRARELAVISLLSVLLYAPFLLGFSSQTKGVGLSADKTPLPSLLILFGPFLFALGAVLVWQGWGVKGLGRKAQAASRGRPGDQVGKGGGGGAIRLLRAAGLLLLPMSALLGGTALLVGLLLLAAAAAAGLLSRRPSEDAGVLEARLFHLILVAAGLLLILGPEYVFLVDLFGTRMNTVFKFHYQAWLLLGLASASAVVWMVAEMRRRVASWLVVSGIALLVGIGLLYPLGATPSKTQETRLPATLDGSAFYQSLRPDDFAAIRWLSQTAVGRPVVLEATGGEYSEYARVSTFSGLPTVLGWAGHEVQWRGRGEEPQQRIQDIDAIYRTADPTTMMALLTKYRVEYLFVGSLEAEKYGAGVFDRFEGRLSLVHRQGRVAIYRVPQVAGGQGVGAE